jgi:hypothetical protein
VGAGWRWGWTAERAELGRIFLAITRRGKMCVQLNEFDIVSKKKIKQDLSSTTTR